MAYFKINLLTPVTNKNESYYLVSTFSEWNSQERYDSIKEKEKYKSIKEKTEEEKDDGVVISKDLIWDTKQPRNFTYSFNEKLKISKNSQKTLSFSMFHNVWKDDNWTTNPFVGALQVGSLILLIDNNEQHHLFTITDISYDFNPQNIQYNFSCQDTFNYQLSRQNEGYTINNDISSTDFIGAKTLDWWIVNKIVPECFIQYKYVPSICGLSVNSNLPGVFPSVRIFPEATLYPTNSSLSDISVSLFINEPINSPYNISINLLQDISNSYNTVVVMKEPLTSQYYQETVPFSCSGSSAAAALISLVEQLECHIEVFEYLHIEDGKGYLDKYFWFVPLKNDHYSGLKYYPEENIQQFSLSQKGTALTTVLNVSSTTVNEEEIGLLPTISPFFEQVVEKEDWQKSEYTSGYYTSLINGKNYIITTSDQEWYNETFFEFTETINDELSITYRAVKINVNLFEQLSYDSQILFNQGDNYSTIIRVGEDQLLSSWNTPYYCIVADSKNNIKYKWTSADIINKTIIEDLQKDWQKENREYNFYIGIVSSAQGRPTKDPLYLIVKPLVSEEDYLFAAAADECPWLENKLFDFSYFVDIKLISEQEYNNLINILYNNLRIVNGQLLIYTKAYYNALHEKTETLAELESALDLLGAHCQAEIIDPYTEEGKIKQPKDFNDTYDELLIRFKDKEDASILGYEEEVSKTFTSYFNAEQRFLKNIKFFRDYFDAPARKSTVLVDRLQIQLDPLEPGKEKKQLLFNGSYFQGIYDKDENDIKTIKPFIHFQDQPLVDIYRDFDKNKTLVPIITSKNYSTFYTPQSFVGSIEAIEVDDIKQYKYNQNNSYFLIEKEYKEVFTNKPIPEDKKIIVAQKTPTQETTTIVYVKLTSIELIQAYLYNHPDQYYTRLTDQYIPLDWIRYSGSADVFKSINNQIIFTPKEQENNADEDIWASYRSQFPLAEIYYYGPKHKLFSKTDNNEETIERVNEKGQTQKEYKKAKDKADKENKTFSATSPSDYKTFQSIPFVSYSFDWNNISSLSWNEIQETVNSQQSDFKYFSRQPNPAGTAWKWVFGSVGTAVMLASFAFPFIGPLVAATGAAIGVIGIGLSDAISNLDENAVLARNWAPARYFTPTNDKWYHAKIDEIPSVWGEGSSSQDEVQGFLNYDSIYALYALDDQASAKNRYYSKLLDNERTARPAAWDYINYYGLIAATYAFEYSSSISNYSMKDYSTAKLWVKNPSFYRLIGHGTTLSPNNTYKIFVLYTSEGKLDEAGLSETQKDWTMFNDKDNNPSFDLFRDNSKLSTRFNSTQFFFVNDEMFSFDIPEENTANIWEEKDENSEKPIIQRFENVNIGSYQDYIFYQNVTIDGVDVSMVFCIVAQENYIYSTITNPPEEEEEINVNWNNHKTFYSKVSISKIYDCETDRRINILNQPDLLKPQEDGITFYRLLTEDENMRPVTGDDLINIDGTEEEKKTFGTYGIDPTKNYYHKDQNNNYIPAYSLLQIQRSFNITEETEEVEESEETEEVEESEKTYAYSIDNNNFVFLNSGILEVLSFNSDQLIYEVPVMLQTMKTTAEGNLIFQNKEEERLELLDFTNVSPKVEENQTISYTKKFKIDDDYTGIITLFKELSTSTEVLTNGGFWWKYHTRSESFIQEECAIIETELMMYWTEALTASKSCKFFLPDSWTEKANGEANHFSNQIINVWNTDDNQLVVSLNTLYVPIVQTYYTEYNKEWTCRLPKYNVSFKRTEIKELSNNEKITNKTLNTNASDLFTNHPAYIQCWDSMTLTSSLDPYNWTIEEVGKQVYYLHISGGTLWRDLINQIAATSRLSKRYDEYNGWYGLKLYLLLTYFDQKELPVYDNLITVKENIWRQLVSQYPCILERVYSNADVVSSEDLRKMAKLELQRYSRPEFDYKITINDIYSLWGYKSHGLKIGDPIQLDTTSYYQDFTQLTNALNQYLFISDISYDLRTDFGISVTVNNLKYTDKLLQELVSLIR